MRRKGIKMESIPLTQAKARLSSLIDRLVHVKGHFAGIPGLKVENGLLP